VNQASVADKMAQVDAAVENDRMAAMTLPKRGMCIVDEHMAIMDRAYFDELLEYSASLPTGTYLGKRWKRNTRGAVPFWKCSECGSEFSGWIDAETPCEIARLRTKRGGCCCGTLQHFKPEAIWYMGEYYDCGSPDQVGIRWRKIEVI
jgi:hypothetical protein